MRATPFSPVYRELVRLSPDPLTILSGAGAATTRGRVSHQRADIGAGLAGLRHPVWPILRVTWRRREMWRLRRWRAVRVTAVRRRINRGWRIILRRIVRRIVDRRGRHKRR